MERFHRGKNFLDRALADTRISRISRSRFDTRFADRRHVRVLPGRLAWMLRRHWGLHALPGGRDRGAVKARNRTAHRQNATDAAMVVATDRGLVSRIGRAAGQKGAAHRSAELIARDKPPR